MIYITLKSIFVKERYLTIFTNKVKFRFFLYTAYNNRKNEFIDLNKYTKIFIISAHLNLIPKILKVEFEKKLAFPYHVKQSFKNDIIFNNKDVKINNILNPKEEKDDNSFPLKIIGNVEKKGRLLGLNNYRYLEVDSANGLIKRFKTADDYPKNPM